MEIDKKTAKKLYPKSEPWFKEQLENEFGAPFFVPNLFEEIKTFEDACKKTGKNPNDVFHKSDTPDEIAYKKLKVVTMVINKKADDSIWEPDWNNSDQKKWYPWFNLSSGFGFSISYYDYDDSNTCVGSRLCFETKEQSDYAANQFSDLYEQLLTIKNK